jgi:hypothetical protein
MGYNTWNDFGCKNLTSESIGLVAQRYGCQFAHVLAVVVLAGTLVSDSCISSHATIIVRLLPFAQNAVAV